MIYKIIFKKRVENFLKSCDKRIQRSFIEKIEILAKNPRSAINKIDIKAIVGERNKYRLRI